MLVHPIDSGYGTMSLENACDKALWDEWHPSDVEARLTSYDNFDDFLQCTHTVLDALGVDIPKHVSTRHLIVKFLHVKKQMRKVSDTQILGIPRMNDKLAM